MDDGDSSGEARGEALDGLRGQGDFGDEEDGAAAEIESLGDRAEVNLCFARSGYSVKEKWGMRDWRLEIERKGGVYGLPRCQLIDGQRGRFGRHKNLPGQRVTNDFLFTQINQFVLSKIDELFW
jgi:hypothetical protein